MKLFDYNQNVEHYIKLLEPGTRLKEMLLDFCKLDSPSKVQNMPEGSKNKYHRSNIVE